MGEVVFGVGTVPGGGLVWKPACPSSCGTFAVYMMCALLAGQRDHSDYIKSNFKGNKLGESLVVQWLGL